MQRHLTITLPVLALGILGTLLILFIALKVIGLLRVSPEDETTGLDISEHGMRAYGE